MVYTKQKVSWSANFWAGFVWKALMFNRQLGVAMIRNESPSQMKNIYWTFFSSTSTNFNTINRLVLFDFYYTLIFFYFILAFVFFKPNCPNSLFSGQLESLIISDNRSSTVSSGC
jgi:hypothetical protein